MSQFIRLGDSRSELSIFEWDDLSQLNGSI
jgi:hypothetical protein